MMAPTHVVLGPVLALPLLVLAPELAATGALAGIAGGIAMSLAVLAMLVVSVLPAYSESWAERLGTSDTTPAGPDPKEVIPGRDEPIDAPGQGDVATPDTAGEDTLDETGSSAIPEPQTAGADEE